MLQAGSRISHFTVVSRLGAGGMGEVLRARDERLDRDVAIKVLPEEVAGDPDRLARFDREARALARLSHPNILGIHEFGEDQGIAFAVTELLEGETVRERLLGGALPWRRAAEIAAAVADGLAAAHAQGIVHRDVKPENVFLTVDGRVKVLDFGLARVDPGPLTVPETMTSPPPGTLAGVVLGTVGYMAPEQVRGHTVDPRSDVFALGCVLYEMLSGRPPFRRDTAAETMTAILREDPPELSGSEAGGPPSELARIAVHCLEKAPEQRFQSAGDVAFALRSVLTTPFEAARTPARRSTRPLLLASAGVVLVAAAAVSTWRPWQRPAAQEALDAKRVVVAVFDNNTGDPSLDPLGRMAADWLTQGLARMGEVEVAPSTSVLVGSAGAGAAGAGGDSLRALAERTGAGTVVAGSYYLDGDRVRLQATITDAIHARLLGAVEPVSGPVAAPMEALALLQQKVMGAVAASLGSMHEIGAQQQPPLYEAYREFIAGFELFGTDNGGALRHFERAAEIDGAFAPPLLYAAYLRYLRGDDRKARDILRDLDTRREQLTPLARHFLDAETAYVEHRYFEMLQTMRSAERLWPRDPLVNSWRSLAALKDNRPREVVETCDRMAVRPWPGHMLGAFWTQNLCTGLHQLGEYRRELEEARTGNRLHPEALRAEELEALAALGRIQELHTVLDEILVVHDRLGDSGEILAFTAVELRAHGHREEAAKLADRATAWFQQHRGSGDGEPHGLVVGSLVLAERWEEAEQRLAERLTVQPDDVRALGELGVVEIRLGREGEARRIDGELAALQGPALFGLALYHRARIAAQLGRREDAVALLRRASAEGFAIGYAIHRDMALEPLRGDAGFEELTRPRG